jgi:glycosidase
VGSGSQAALRFTVDLSYRDRGPRSNIAAVVKGPRLRASLLFAALLVGCGGEPSPSVDCHQPVWAQPRHAGSDLRVVGSWDGWQKPGTALAPRDDGFWLALLELPPGEYGYEIAENGVTRLDTTQPLTTYDGDREVSLLIAADCDKPALSISKASADDKGALSLDAAFLARHGGAGIASATMTLDGAALDLTKAAKVETTAATGAVHASASGLGAGKHLVKLTATDGDGAEVSAEASVWVAPAAETWEDAVLYQIVVDRFRGDGGAPLAPPATPGTRAGGTLDGVRAEIEKGTFASLGVSALWLSPVYANPDDFRLGRDGHLSEGYHGYWPLGSRAVEPRQGGEAALRALMQSAHAHGLRVLFDVVPNHVYEKNPIFLDHQHDGWFTNEVPHCVCGDPGCDWTSSIIDCWFTPFLPDVRWQSGAAMKSTLAETLFWMQRFDADGVRIDAVPMMPRMTTRRMVRALRDARAPDRAFFALGEVFTGAGQIDNIRYFMGKDGLDSAFDFPLMWAMRAALAGHGALGDVEATIADAEEALRGSGAVMARMLDNHDTNRFLSEAAGDGGNDAWANPPKQPTEERPYARQRMALALVFALPGMPLVYYGDEVSLAGASDPDDRRVLPADEALSEQQLATRTLVKRLGWARRCLPALRRGERVPVWADTGTLAFARDAGDGDPALALFSTAPSEATITIPGGVVPPGDYLDALSGETLTLTGGDAIAVHPSTARLLIPAHHPACVNMP